MRTLKSRVSEPVTFVHYQDGNLIYKCQSDGFEFSVPIEDCGSARFLASDKGMIFMKWIRKQMQVLEKGENEV